MGDEIDGEFAKRGIISKGYHIRLMMIAVEIV